MKRNILIQQQTEDPKGKHQYQEDVGLTDFCATTEAGGGFTEDLKGVPIPADLLK